MSTAFMPSPRSRSTMCLPVSCDLARPSSSVPVQSQTSRTSCVNSISFVARYPSPEGASVASNLPRLGQRGTGTCRKPHVPCANRSLPAQLPLPRSSRATCLRAQSRFPYRGIVSPRRRHRYCGGCRFGQNEVTSARVARCRSPAETSVFGPIRGLVARYTKTASPWD